MGLIRRGARRLASGVLLILVLGLVAPITATAGEPVAGAAGVHAVHDGDHQPSEAPHAHDAVPSDCGTSGDCTASSHCSFSCTGGCPLPVNAGHAAGPDFRTTLHASRTEALPAPIPAVPHRPPIAAEA